MKRRKPTTALDPPRSQSSSDHLQPASPTDQYPRSVRFAEDIIRKLPPRCQIVARIQMVTGARAMEILSLRWRHVQRGGWIYVRAGKRSTKRAVYIGELLTVGQKPTLNPDGAVFGTLSYWQYYRHIKAAAGSKLPTSARRDKVTNLFRVAAADLVRALAAGAPEAAQHLLGHKSSRSTRYYLTKEACSHG